MCTNIVFWFYAGSIRRLGVMEFSMHIMPFGSTVLANMVDVVYMIFTFMVECLLGSESVEHSALV